MPQGLEIHTGNRLEGLVEGLAERLASHPLPPLEHELVVVESLGMGRWLTLELARRSGLAAGLDTPFPRSLIRWLARRVLGGEALPASEPLARADDSPWGREILTWRIDRLLGEEHPALAVLAAYIAGGGAVDPRKRHALAGQLASLFDAYQLYRPQWLRAWQHGETADLASQRLEVGAEDRVPESLRETAEWQAHLWRRLRDDTEVAPLSESLLQLRQALSESPRGEVPGLPARLSVFGVSTLPPAFLDLLAAIARHCPVALYFTSPTAAYWADLRSEREQIRIAERARRPSRIESGEATEPPDDGQYWEIGNPLLVALGRQGRDFFDLLQQQDPTGQGWHEHFAPSPASGDSGAPTAASALAVIQSDLLELVDRAPADRLPLERDDASLAFAVCHGPLREMEVLRDRLLAAFDEMPGLRPADILVLVPDVETYGPLVQAVFGVDHADGRRLPFSIADRRAGRERPPAESLLQVLALVDARRTVAEVFDLLDVPAVRHRAGLAAADLPALRRRVVRSGVRWGASGAAKARDFDLPAEPQNTWQAGLDRLLLGSATGALDTPVLGVVPAAGDLPGDTERLGRLLAFVDSLFAWLDALRAPRPPAAWREVLLAVVDDLFRATDDADELGLQLAREAIDSVARSADSAAFHEPVPRRVLLDELTARLDGGGFGSGFVDGRITVCALQPMRAVPFRVVAICGLDDASFPRRVSERDFDLIARQPRRGDRTPRDDDRYLFLETLLAARERLAISWVGRSQRDGTALEPSLVVEELLAAVDRTFLHPDDLHPDAPSRPARQALIEDHPLQPWSASYFEASAPTSYSLENLAAARAALEPRAPLPAFLGDPSREDDSAEEDLLEDDSAADDSAGEAPSAAAPSAPDLDLGLDLDELLRFWRNPSAAYARTLGLRTLDEPDDEDESEPFSLDGLASWALRNELLETALARRQLASAGPHDTSAHHRALYRGQGVLPAGSLGASALAAEERRAEAFAETVSSLLPRVETGPTRTLETDDRFAQEVDLICPLRDGRQARLIGRVRGVLPTGLLRYRCATLRPRDRLSAWIEHLALQASGVPGTGLALGETRGVRFDALEPAVAQRLLEPLLRGFLEGHDRPLPVFERASSTFEAERRKAAGRTARHPQGTEAVRAAARRAFASPAFQGRGPRPDLDDPDIARIHRGADPIADDDFAEWATAIWGPLLEAEEELPR